MSTRARPQTRPDIAAMEGYHSPQVSVRVRLNTNESPYPPPPEWQADLAEEVARIDYHRYPDRAAWALREAIGELHGVGPEWVLAANGSNEVIQTVCLTYAGTGRSVAVFEPTYALHSHLARLSGATVVVGARNADFSLSQVEIDRVVDQADPAITFLCSPNNPTGELASPDLVRHVVATNPGIVLVDEAYGQFAPWSAQALLSDDTPLIISRTYSKTWSMAAVRLGYLLAPPWLVAELEKVVLPYHLDSLKQVAGILALRHVDDMRARVELLVAGRERIMATLRTLDVDVWPSASNFILFRPTARDANLVWQGLVDRSVLVRNCGSWPGLAGCLRVTVGTPAEDDEFLDALREVLASSPSARRTDIETETVEAHA